MKARVVYTDVVDGTETIEVNDHKMDFGGIGDSYCYNHQSFDCYANLTEEEWEAIRGLDEE